MLNYWQGDGIPFSLAAPQLSLQRVRVFKRTKNHFSRVFVRRSDGVLSYCSRYVIQWSMVWLSSLPHTTLCCHPPSVCFVNELVTLFTDDKLLVNWTNNSGTHAGFLPIKWLKEHNYSALDLLMEKQANTQPLFAVCQTSPYVWL